MAEGYVGFVYLITNLSNAKVYIGKKWFLSSQRKKPLKGKRRRRRVVKTSNWEKYWGSNKALLEDVKTLGEESFTREILHLCRSKGECSYLEAKEQFDRDVLLSDSFYNTFIGCRINKSHLKP